MIKYRILAAVAAVKILILFVWMSGVWGYFNTGLASAAVASEGAQETAADKHSPKVEDEKGLLAAINRRQKELDAREEDIKVKEERLQAVRKDIEAKIEELKKVRVEIEAFAGKIDAADSDRVKRLVKIYESMNPEEAAPRIEKLETNTAVTILSGMSEKKAAKIFELMKVEKSVALSQALKIKKD